MATRQPRGRNVRIQLPLAAPAALAAPTNGKRLTVGHLNLKSFLDEVYVPDAQCSQQSRTMLPELHHWLTQRRLPLWPTDAAQLSKAIDALTAAGACQVTFSIERNVRVYNLRHRHPGTPAPQPAPAAASSNALPAHLIRQLNELVTGLREFSRQGQAHGNVQQMVTALETIGTSPNVPAPRPARGRAMLSRSATDLGSAESSDEPPAPPLRSMTPNPVHRSVTPAPARRAPAPVQRDPNELSMKNLDHLREFLRDPTCCQVDVSGQLSAKVIMDRFNQWQQSRNRPVYTSGPEHFSKYLSKCEVASTKVRTIKVFQLRLIPST